MVVAEVLGQVGRVDGREHLLGAELIHRVAGFLVNPLVERGLLIIRRLGAGNEAVAPVDGIHVVNAKGGRRELDTLLHIAGLCHIVVARIVHDARRGAVLLSKRGVAQLLHGESVAGTHVMHQPQTMTHLVRGRILDGLAHHIVVELRFSDAWINGTRLHEPPVVEQRHNIMIPNHVGRKNLPRARILIARTHGVGRRRSDIAEATVAHVVRIEVGVVLRIIFYHNGILEARLLKGMVPFQDTILDGLAPLLGECGVNIKHDLLLRLDELTVEIARTVARLQPPAVDKGLAVDAVGIRAEDILLVVEIAYPIVL